MLNFVLNICLMLRSALIHYAAIRYALPLSSCCGMLLPSPSSPPPPPPRADPPPHLACLQALSQRRPLCVRMYYSSSSFAPTTIDNDTIQPQTALCCSPRESCNSRKALKLKNVMVFCALLCSPLLCSSCCIILLLITLGIFSFVLGTLNRNSSNLYFGILIKDQQEQQHHQQQQLHANNLLVGISLASCLSVSLSVHVILTNTTTPPTKPPRKHLLDHTHTHGLESPYPPPVIL